MMMRQQQQDRRDELERQRRADAQVQMQNTMMQTMMMAMLANSGVPMGGVMQSLNSIQAAAGSSQAAAGEGARTTARERNETRQREREEERNQAWLRREESIQAALDADPNITRAELERMLNEEDRVRDGN